MAIDRSRREFLRSMGLGAAALPFVCNLPSFAKEAPAGRKQRFVVMFTPDGVIPEAFWPDEEGKDFNLKESTSPLEPFKDQMLVLHGLSNGVQGDGCNHLRGMGCLLTGAELFPGNIQGGSDTPAGWAKGLSIDQELAGFFQEHEASRTRFGSLEYGVMVPNRATTVTRMVYAGPNQPVAPIDNPYQMFQKLYGTMKNRENLVSILDEVQLGLKKISKVVTAEDRDLLNQHTTLVREMEERLRIAAEEDRETDHPVPELDQGVMQDNDNMPRLTKMQMDLMVNSFLADFARVQTLQMTAAVGQAHMHWLGIDEGQHGLSHKPDSDEDAVRKITAINKWYCEQLAYLCRRLRETPEPGGNGNMLDNTLVMLTNELGKGNNHTHHNVPFVLIGGGANFKMGRSLKFKDEYHNRLLMAISGGFGHPLEEFGHPDYCGKGPLTGLG